MRKEISKEEYKQIAKDVENLIQTIEAKTSNAKMVIGERMGVELALEKLKAASDYIKTINSMKV